MKIIGVTVGTTTPRANWLQTDPKKADFILGKPDLDDDVVIATTDTLGSIIVGENLKISANGVLSVNTTTEMDVDNTKPITSAAVAVQVGNIQALLETI